MIFITFGILSGLLGYGLLKSFKEHKKRSKQIKQVHNELKQANPSKYITEKLKLKIKAEVERRIQDIKKRYYKEFDNLDVNGFEICADSPYKKFVFKNSEGYVIQTGSESDAFEVIFEHSEKVAVRMYVLYKLAGAKEFEKAVLQIKWDCSVTLESEDDQDKIQAAGKLRIAHKSINAKSAEEYKILMKLKFTGASKYLNFISEGKIKVIDNRQRSNEKLYYERKGNAIIGVVVPQKPENIEEDSIDLAYSNKILFGKIKKEKELKAILLELKNKNLNTVFFGMMKEANWFFKYNYDGIKEVVKNEDEGIKGKDSDQLFLKNRPNMFSLDRNSQFTIATAVDRQSNRDTMQSPAPDFSNGLTLNNADFDSDKQPVSLSKKVPYMRRTTRMAVGTHGSFMGKNTLVPRKSEIVIGSKNNS